MRRLLLSFIAVLPIVALAADPPKSGDSAVIVDGSGKEIVLKKWTVSGGLRKLHWLGANAPEALAFRETNSTTFRDGVLTLVPLDRLESLTYDAAKLTVHAKVAGVEKPLEGSTRFTGINQVAIEAEIDKGEMGTLEVKYRGGPAKGGIKSVTFPARKAGPTPKGDALYVTISDGKKKEGVAVVHQMQALYRIDKGEKLLPYVMFKKTFKVDLAKVKKLTVHESEQKSFECDVVLDDGTEQTLTLLTEIAVEGKPAILEGLLGETSAGWKLLPVHTIGEISREEPKKEPEKKPPVDGVKN